MTYQAGLFKGKRALVAGATQGIGAVIANHLAALGADVTALGLGGGDGTLAAGVEVRQADVTSAASLDAALAGIDHAGHRLQLRRHHPARRRARHRGVRNVLAVNLTGTMRVCTAARERLKASRGCIVNTASMLSFFGGGLVPGYAASKGGVAQLTKSLAIAYAPDGIRRQRHRPRLDRHAAHASAAGRPGARRPHPGAHAHGPLGHAQRRGRGGDVSLHAGGRVHDRGDPAGGWGLYGVVKRCRVLAPAVRSPVLLA